MDANLEMPALRKIEQSTERRAVLSRRIRWFVAATIAYNIIEAVVALTEGVRASSAALIGFGLDSVIEVSSAAAVAWQFSARDPESREKIALRIIAFSFFALALYVTIDAVRSLLGVGEARPSTVGIALASVSLAVMPVLSWGQRRTGRELGSLSAVADSKQTLLCTYLSAVLLVGLLLNSLLGWTWADPDSRARDRSDRREGRPGRVAWRHVLRADIGTPPRQLRLLRRLNVRRRALCSDSGAQRSRTHQPPASDVAVSGDRCAGVVAAFAIAARRSARFIVLSRRADRTIP